MRTRLTYENGSLNPHVGRVGLIWDVSDMGPGVKPLLWRVIERCRFGWHHPVPVDWQASFEICDPSGNRSPLLPGSRHGETGTGIDVTRGHGLRETVRLHQAEPRPDLSLHICRNGHGFAKVSLAETGERLLLLPSRLMFRLDCGGETGSQVATGESTAFDLDGLAALTVRLRGGAPGPGSTPLSFISYRAEPA